MSTVVLLQSCAWSGATRRYEFQSPVFIIIAVDVVFELTGISLFLYCFIKSMRITAPEHKTSEYRKYQMLRILVILLGLCCLLEAIHVLVSFSNCFDITGRIISTGKDTINGITSAVALWQIGILLKKYSPRSGRYRLILCLFVILNMVLNILDILCAVFDDNLYYKMWGYFQIALIPIIFLVSAIALNYYCRLRQYIKGESVLAILSTISLSPFRKTMVMEYRRACKMLFGLATQNIVWCIWLVLLITQHVDDKYYYEPPFLILKLVGHCFHRIGFLFYLWIRNHGEPIKEEECMKESSPIQQFEDNPL